MTDLLTNIKQLAAEKSLPALEFPAIKFFDSLPSTMDQARHEVSLNNSQPLIIYANQQTEGRGRQGRSWYGQHSGLYTTIAFSIVPNTVNLSGFSLMVGTSIIKALEVKSGAVQLKWPNDILTKNGQKLGGVLIETFNSADMLNILIGIGVNLSGSLPENLKAATLRDIGINITATELLAKLYIELSSDWQLFKQSGFAGFRDFWWENYAHRNTPVSFQLGNNQVTGMAIDVDSTGALKVLEASGQMQTVTVGDVNAI